MVKGSGMDMEREESLFVQEMVFPRVRAKGKPRTEQTRAREFNCKGIPVNSFHPASGRCWLRKRGRWSPDLMRSKTEGNSRMLWSSLRMKGKQSKVIEKEKIKITPWPDLWFAPPHYATDATPTPYTWSIQLIRKEGKIERLRWKPNKSADEIGMITSSKNVQEVNYVQNMIMKKG